MVATQRKLTTILSADVEGYSRLMGADEEGTFSTLKSLRDVIARHIAAYDGRVINTWGDALLAEFPSVVSAVRAAIDAQSELAERNAGKPAEQRMLYRFGVNLGDVIIDGDDIYGDGVNIAARLQNEAPPGGVLISSTVHDQVRNKLAVGFEFLGNLHVKNIEEEVPAFSVRVGEPVSSQPERRKPAEPKRPPAQAARPTFEGSSLWFDRLELRSLAVSGVIVAALAAVNIITWNGVFWAAWPILVLASLGGFAWARRTSLLPRSVAWFGVMSAMVATINALTWSGYFWAVWPILAMGVVTALRLVGRRGG